MARKLRSKVLAICQDNEDRGDEPRATTILIELFVAFCVASPWRQRSWSTGGRVLRP
jgi:hypothetical protein